MNTLKLDLDLEKLAGKKQPREKYRSSVFHWFG